MTHLEAVGELHVGLWYNEPPVLEEIPAILYREPPIGSKGNYMLVSAT